MSEFTTNAEQIRRLEKAIAEMSPLFGKIAGVNEAILHLTLMVFQCLQRNRQEYASSLRLLTDHSTAIAAGSRKQILDQIAQYELESKLTGDLLSETIAKLCVAAQRCKAEAASPPVNG